MAAEGRSLRTVLGVSRQTDSQRDLTQQAGCSHFSLLLQRGGRGVGGSRALPLGQRFNHWSPPPPPAAVAVAESPLALVHENRAGLRKRGRAASSSQAHPPPAVPARASRRRGRALAAAVAARRPAKPEKRNALRRRQRLRTRSPPDWPLRPGRGTGRRPEASEHRQGLGGGGLPPQPSILWQPKPFRPSPSHRTGPAHGEPDCPAVQSEYSRVGPGWAGPGRSRLSRAGHRQHLGPVCAGPQCRLTSRRPSGSGGSPWPCAAGAGKIYQRQHACATDATWPRAGRGKRGAHPWTGHWKASAKGVVAHGPVDPAPTCVCVCVRAGECMCCAHARFHARCHACWQAQCQACRVSRTVSPTLSPYCRAQRHAFCFAHCYTRGHARTRRTGSGRARAGPPPWRSGPSSCAAPSTTSARASREIVTAAAAPTTTTTADGGGSGSTFVDIVSGGGSCRGGGVGGVGGGGT